MTRLMQTLITGTALMILPLNLAYADGSTSTPDGTLVLNGQVDFQITSSKVNTSITNAVGNVSGSSSSVGNNLEVVTMDNANVANSQYVSGISISADQNATVQNVGGTTTLQSQAICNAADVSTDPTTTAVNSSQVCHANDPSALLNASVTNAGNDVSLSSQAVGNSFSEDTNAPSMPTQNYQNNASNIASTVNSKVTNVSGNVTVNSSAIGNNAQIVQY
jgi:hypothetical protein